MTRCSKKRTTATTPSNGPRVSLGPTAAWEPPGNRTWARPQYTLAGADPLPPHLQTMAPVSASSDFHQSWVYHTGGAMEWGWMVPYAIHKGRNTLERAGREDLLAQMDEYVLEPDNFARPLRDSWYRHLPLRDWIDRLKETAPYFSEYFDQELDGPYWWRINLLKQAHHVDLPMFHVSSWYDIFLEGALNSYQAMRDRPPTAKARNGQKLLVGPWAHIRPYTAPTSGDTGDIDFGPESEHRTARTPVALV